jgi:hypothetical protein
MPEIASPFEEDNAPRPASPGEKAQTHATWICEALEFVGIDLTPDAKQAVALLIEEILPQWSKVNAKLSWLMKFVKNMNPVA